MLPQSNDSSRRNGSAHRYDLSRCLLVFLICTHSIAGAEDWKTARPRDAASIEAFTHALQTQHVLGRKIDREVVDRSHCELIDRLDPAKLQFLFGDKVRLRFRTGGEGLSVSQGEMILESYLEASGKHLAWISEILSTSIDLDKTDLIPHDGRWADRATTEEELKKRWRLKLKQELIELILTGISEKEAKQLLVSKYRQADQSARAMSREEFLSQFLNSVACCLDNRSCYLSPATRDKIIAHADKEYVGMGIDFEDKHGELIISNILSGSPAEKTRQLSLGDRLIAVENEKGERRIPSPLNPDDVFAHIPRKKGIPITLIVKSGGAEERKVRIIQDDLKVPEDRARVEHVSVPTSRGTKTIRVIHLPSFYKSQSGSGREHLSSSKEVEALLGNQELIDGLILDLRGNGGGVPNEALSIANLFVGPKNLIQVKEGNKAPEMKKIDKPAQFKKPLVVLIDRECASAGDAFAKIIQSNGRGLVVGDPQTFGKGTVQKVSSLKIPGTEETISSGIAITTSTLYSKDGEPLQGRGVKSDIVHPTALAEMTEMGERFLKNSLEVEPLANSKKSDDLLPASVIEKVKIAHEKRMASDKDLQELKKWVSEMGRKPAATTELSLPLAKEERARKKQMQERLEQLGGFGVVRKPRPFGTDAYTREVQSIMGDYLDALVNEDISSQIDHDRGATRKR